MKITEVKLTIIYNYNYKHPELPFSTFINKVIFFLLLLLMQFKFCQEKDKKSSISFACVPYKLRESGCLRLGSTLQPGSLGGTSNECTLG